MSDELQAAPDKLQELTDKLYNEGLSRGREEGERFLAKAKENAARIITRASEEAAALRAQAEKDAAAAREKAEADIRMASAQCIQATKKDIENLLVNRISRENVKSALADTDLMKKMILAVSSAFSASEGKDISLLLPQSLKDNLEEWVASELAGRLETGVEASFSKKVGGGFAIGPRDGSWFISLTDETFVKIISEYIRPATRKLLFGE